MVLNFLAGVAMAIANVIPGVSGGTMAVIMGIYDRLVGLFALDFKQIRKDWKFILNIFAGILVGLVLFSNIITWLLERYPIPTCFFFIGLIVGSMPMLIGKVREDGKWPSWPNWLIFAGALGVMVLMAVLRGASAEAMPAETVFSMPLAGKLFGSAIVAAAAMIIPGISGSSLLLVFGTYTTFYKAVGSLNIPLLIPMGLGVVVGLVGGSRVIRLLLRRWPVATYSAIIDLVIGSILVVWPSLPGGMTILWSVLTFAAGAAAAWFLGK